MDWFISAVLAMLAFSLVFLIYKKIGDLGVGSELTFVYYFGISAILLLAYIYFNKMPMMISNTALIFILLAALAGVFGNVLLFNSLRIAPNPGYALAVVGLNTLVVAVMSIFIFKAEFTLTKGIGTILAVLGVVLIGWK